MKLNMFTRVIEKKREAKRIRREGNIPGILYAQNKPAEPIAVPNNDFTALLRKVQSGHLSTTIFNLVDDQGKERRAIIKDIQYNITNYDVIHLDFEELHDNVKVNVKVPIECTGIVDCIGVKLGGVIRQVIRNIRVRCLPKDIPQVFELDVRNLGMRESRRLSDLAIPTGVRPLANLHEVAVVIVKR